MEEKEFDYINVIPLVDVMLVLLTIVLTSSTFIAAGVIPVDLPSVSQPKETTLKVQTIEIDEKGLLYFNSTPSTLKELQDSFRPMDKTVPVLIKADRNIVLQVFVDVLDVIKNLGLQRVSLQTEIKR